MLQLACGERLQALRGVVEVDELFLGGLEKNKHADKKLGIGGGGSVGKQIVIGMKERGGKVKGMKLENTQKDTFQRVVLKNVDRDAIVYTDEFSGYVGLDSKWGV